MTTRPLPPPASAALLLGWRLGLGWLLGRRWLVLTTVTPDGTPRRSVVRYGFAGGNFYVPADGGPWQGDLADRHTATVQSYPGPKGVAGRIIGDATTRRTAMAVLERERPRLAAGMGTDQGLYEFTPTGERVPEMLLPDLVWAWAPAVVGSIVLRRVLRRA